VIREGTENRSTGFTLLELMISMTVLGIIMALVYGAMRLGTRTWERGQAQTDEWQRRQAVMDLIARQFGSTYIPEGKLYERNPVFFGGTDRVVFYSNLPLAPRGDIPGMVFVRYRVERNGEGRSRLLLVERVPDFPEAFKAEDDPPDDQWEVLADGLAGIDFAYLKKTPGSEEEPWEWTPEWEPSSEKAPPAIRVSLRWEEDEPAMDLVIPIHRGGLSAT
jgi:general secretion pathway protein J